jgi:hypothetical protein
MPSDPGRLPSRSEFLFAARKQGVQISERTLKIGNPKTPGPPVHYLRRGDGLPVIVPTLQRGDVVQAPLLSTLCRLLEVDPSSLGISLDELEQEADD